MLRAGYVPDLERNPVTLPFTKYQGLGNDFVVIDVERPDAIDSSAAQRLCDRHFGVGADGVLLVSPTPEGAARMTVLNADGSQPEMCGNGLRCVVLHLHLRDPSRTRFEVATGAGLLDAELSQRDGEHWVRIGLGQARSLGALRFDHGGRTFEFDRWSMGNPHAVIFDTGLDVTAIDALAPRVSATIPQGANIEFVEQRGPTQLSTVVWERGVGRTLACGTGAGAVVAAATQRGRVPYDTPISVELPGGVLEISVRQRDLAVELSGPARRVFAGELALP